jgi:hypothetical protein
MERQITKRQNDNANDETENTRVVKKTKTLSSGLFFVSFSYNLDRCRYRISITVR